jgi:excisionase family DNA binding protein
MERLLTARELAARLAVSPETVLRWTRRGELPARKLPGGAVRYLPDEVDTWLDDHAAPGRGKRQQTSTGAAALSVPGGTLPPASKPGRHAAVTRKDN